MLRPLLLAGLKSYDLTSSISTACMIYLSLDSGRVFLLIGEQTNPPLNIDEHWVAIKKLRFSGATQVVRHALNGRHKIWLIGESWKRVDGRKGLKVQLTAASDGVGDTFELRYRAKFQLVGLVCAVTKVILVLR